jgi:hypothetical protein
LSQDNWRARPASLAQTLLDEVATPVDSLQLLYFIPARLFRESRRNALQIKAVLAGNRWASLHFRKFSLQIGKLQGGTSPVPLATGAI